MPRAVLSAMTGSSLPTAVVAVALVWVSTAAVLWSQPAGGSASELRTELTLDFHTVAVSFDPGLHADDPNHASVLAGDGGLVRVGRLEAPASLEIGTVEAGTDPDARRSFDLWLEANERVWELGVYPPELDAPTASDRTGQIPLTHRRGDRQDTLSPAIVGMAPDAGRLILRWGEHRWSADFALVEREEDRGPPPDNTSQGASRQPDTDTSAIARERVLNERNETALVVGDGRRVSVTFWKGITAEDDDFAQLSLTPDGAVVSVISGAVIRLRSDLPLRVGDARLDPGNQAPGYPGTYGVWLKKRGQGWRLVFNHEADAWGTQHDPAFDAAEIDAEHTLTGDASRPLAVTLVPLSADRGQLRLHWGPHEWAADFVIPDP